MSPHSVIRMMCKRHMLVLGGVVVALATGAGTALSASDSTNHPSFLDDFAKHLGVSTAKVQSAWLQTVSDRLQQAVKDGRLTQAQANQILARMKQNGGDAFGGPGPMFGPGDMRHGPHSWGDGALGFGDRPFPYPGGGLTAAAGYLHVSPATLFKQLHSGKTLAALAAARHLSVAGLEQAMVKANKAALDAAVTSGHITESERTRIEAAIGQHVHDFVAHGFPSFGHDSDHGWNNEQAPKPSPGSATAPASPWSQAL